MRIVELNAENVKRLRAVHIKPDGAIIPITGKNGQGKSSVLDAIACALGGKATQPMKPIRDGAGSASVVLDLGDLIITRTWTANDKSYLAVQSKEGAKFPTPQAMLDKLVGELTFDPLAFSRMHPTDQIDTLKRIAGLDFSQLDAEREEVFAERTGVNRDLKAAEVHVVGIPKVEAPDEEIRVAELLAEQSAANQKIRDNDAIRADHAATIRMRDAAIDRVDRLESELKTARKEMESWESKAAANAKAKLTDPDVAAINKRISEAESINRNVRAKKDRASREAAVLKHRKKSESLTSRLDTIDAEKSKALADAKMPIKGLSFTDQGITFDDIPFSQASSAQQLRISVAMGAALNPKLRVMLIRDGSLLDSESLALLAEMAETHDLQIWLERVSDGESVGVVIEDGAVRKESTKGRKPELVAD
jgi:predicted ATP-dependent endonuclease of OLD family